MSPKKDKDKVMKDVIRLGIEKWRVLQPKVHAASKFSAQSLQNWADICAEAVADRPRSHWRWVLLDLREYCIQDPEAECPYQVSYLVQLAETHQKVKGDLINRGVQPSVLIEGRHLDDLLDIIEPGMTVSRMKAIIYQRAHPKDQRELDEIEAVQSAKRRDGRDRAGQDNQVKKILSWKAEDAHNLLPFLKREVEAYEETIKRLSEEVVFDGRDVSRTLRGIKDLNETLTDMAPVKARAA